MIRLGSIQLTWLQILILNVPNPNAHDNGYRQMGTASDKTSRRFVPTDDTNPASLASESDRATNLRHYCTQRRTMFRLTLGQLLRVASAKVAVEAEHGSTASASTRALNLWRPKPFTTMPGRSGSTPPSAANASQTLSLDRSGSAANWTGQGTHTDAFCVGYPTLEGRSIEIVPLIWYVISGTYQT